MEFYDGIITQGWQLTRKINMLWQPHLSEGAKTDRCHEHGGLFDEVEPPRTVNQRRFVANNCPSRLHMRSLTTVPRRRPSHIAWLTQANRRMDS